MNTFAKRNKENENDSKIQKDKHNVRCGRASDRGDDMRTGRRGAGSGAAGARDV